MQRRIKPSGDEVVATMTSTLKKNVDPSKVALTQIKLLVNLVPSRVHLFKF